MINKVHCRNYSAIIVSGEMIKICLKNNCLLYAPDEEWMILIMIFSRVKAPIPLFDWTNSLLM
jgi:hypothetical protein